MSQLTVTGSQPRPASPELLPDSPGPLELHPPSPDLNPPSLDISPQSPDISPPTPDINPPTPADLPDSETYTQPVVNVDEDTRDTGFEPETSSVTSIAPWSRQNGAGGNIRTSQIRTSLDENTRTSSASGEDTARPPSGLEIDEGTRNSTRSDATEAPNEDSSPAFPSDTRECDEPPTKIRKVNSPKYQEETDGETCPICLDSWGNSGDHRLVALKCGHLFGATCVQRWLRAQPARDRSCPTCKSRASVKDLRFIYARRLVAADTSQVTSLQKQIETLQAEKNRTELELQKSKISHRACSMQLEVLRSLMKSQQAGKEHPVRRSWRFALEKNLEMCKDGGCRVLTYNCRTYELYVSQKSGNYLFPGYGIRKVSCLDYKPGQFVHLHPKPIRDMTYSQPRDLLLSVGLDSSARVVERGIPSVTVHAGLPLWSCSWDYLRSNEFYVGGVGGVIHQYDVRNPSGHVQVLSAPGDMSPVVSLRSTEFGLLSCQLNSCWLWVGSARPWEPRSLPVEGSFMSLCYDNETHRALVSCRPTASGLERSKLTLCKLKASVLSGEVLFDVEETFSGSARASLMSRPSWVRVPGAAWVAAHSESDSALYLHGLDGARTMSLPAAEPALDVACVELNGSTILAALSESRLRIYKGVPTNT